MVIRTVVPAKRFAPVAFGCLTVRRTAVRQVDPRHTGTCPGQRPDRTGQGDWRGHARDGDDTPGNRSGRPSRRMNALIEW